MDFMRLHATALAVSIAVMGFAGDASAINDSDPIVVNAYDNVCSMDIPRPDTATGESRTNRECTCVLVGPQVILTNSACLAVNVEDADPPQVAGIEVRFEEAGTVYEIDDIALYRYYDPDLTSVDGLSGVGFTEFALAHLTADPGITPAIVNTEPLPSIFSTASVQIVGFGETGPGVDDFPSKNGIEVGVRNIQYPYFSAGTETSTTCPGDHGAPVFGMLGGETRLVAITAFDLVDRCFDNINRMRVDRVANDFILPYVNRYHGPGDCLANEVCSAAACDVPDPDCDDDCVWQGGGAADCDETCAPRDFDCPLGSLPGFGCTGDSDCEFGASCIAAEDDATFTYCANACDSAGVTAQPACGNGLECVSGRCVYGTPSRGSQGFACAQNTDCRSDICESEVCVFECSGPSECDTGFDCLPSKVEAGVNVCRLPDLAGGGGFCSVRATGETDGFPGTLAAFAFALVLAGTTLRRRKR